MTNKGKYEHGDFIELHWLGSEPWYAVKGHVWPEEFAKAVAPLADYVGDPISCYGRWSMDATNPDVDYCLWVYRERGRGRFPVTIGVRAHCSIDYKDKPLLHGHGMEFHSKCKACATERANA